MNHAHKKSARKKAVNLSISEDLLAEAKAENINLSQLLETILKKDLAKKANEAFCKAHAAEIAEMNEEAAEFGVFSDKYGLF